MQKTDTYAWGELCKVDQDSVCRFSVMACQLWRTLNVAILLCVTFEAGLALLGQEVAQRNLRWPEPLYAWSPVEAGACVDGSESVCLILQCHLSALSLPVHQLPSIFWLLCALGNDAF
jgi:hypothetical protein